MYKNLTDLDIAIEDTYENIAGGFDTSEEAIKAKKDIDRNLAALKRKYPAASDDLDTLVSAINDLSFSRTAYVYDKGVKYGLVEAKEFFS